MDRLSLRPQRGLNLFLGANAAGKTTLLESIYCLGRAKSFRGNSPSELAGAGGRQWTIAAKLEAPSAPPTTVGVKWDSGGTQIHVAGAPAVSAELVRALPVQILEPGMHRLLQDGPTYRRAFLDWGVFHVEHDFHQVWRRYQRALRQRNQALRSHARQREVSAWDVELAESGAAMQRMRGEHLRQLREGFVEFAARFLGVSQWSLELHPGWTAGKTLPEALRAGMPRDQKLGTTVEGPHRAELRIRMAERQVKNHISRGQQKLLIGALLLSQCRLIGDQTGISPILLVDDFSAELAEPFQAKLLDELERYPGQVFVTAFERSGAFQRAKINAMFHVERGRITPAEC